MSSGRAANSGPRLTNRAPAGCNPRGLHPSRCRAMAPRRRLMVCAVVMLLWAAADSLAAAQEPGQGQRRPATPANATTIAAAASPARRQAPASIFNKGHEAGCKEFRSQRYISDGKCSTKRPISEVVCAEWCIMAAAPPGGTLSEADRSSYYSEADWRAWRRQRSGAVHLEKWWCADGATRRRRVKMVCADASVRVYHVRVVKSCRCSRSKPEVKTRPSP